MSWHAKSMSVPSFAWTHFCGCLAMDAMGFFAYDSYDSNFVEELFDGITSDLSLHPSIFWRHLLQKWPDN